MKKVKYDKIEVGDAIFVPIFCKTYRVAVKNPQHMVLQRGKDDTWVVTRWYYDHNRQYFKFVDEW